jgi:type IV secretion system protein VirD4
VTQARYLRLVLLIAMSQFMRFEKGNHQVLMMLDEFANLGKLNIIENGYGLIAGHGVTLWSFVQNLTQLQNLYPKNWETFIRLVVTL